MKLALNKISFAVLLIGCLFGIFNVSLIVFFSYAALAGAIQLISKCDGPPILIIPFGFQFLQINIRSIQSSFSGKSIDEYSMFGYDVEPAMLLCSACLIAILIGIAFVSRRRSGKAEISVDAGGYSYNKIATTALILIGLGHGFDILSTLAAPSRQLFEGLAVSKWAGLFVLVWVAYRRPRFSILAIAVSLTEIGFGLGGFFGSFREPIYIVLGAILVAATRLRPSAMLLGGGAFFFMIWLASFWTYVKPDYREFVNQGTNSQVVLVPYGERMAYLFDAASNFDGGSFETGFNQLADRIAYVEYPAVVMGRVPSIIPHAHGEQTKKAILHVLLPRLLYPNKPPLELDTVLTNQYTGLHEGFNEGTSISLGYMAELYIDYGVIGAVLGCLVIGLIIGFLYKQILQFNSVPSIFNVGLLMGTVLSLAIFETSLTKFIGSLLVAFITALMLQRLALPMLLKLVGGGPKRHDIRYMTDAK
ncbi:hypothetical protein [Aquidulcibacter sp.]|uniref:hypothetical protein n=1 Tax=Aquidulcibacter sp. TaxID=2052990 RepID=UPI003BA743BB